MRFAALVTLILFSWPYSVQASEIDSFTPRYSGLESQTDKLNALTQEVLLQVIDEANGSWFVPRGCNPKTIRRKIWWPFWSHVGSFRAVFREGGPLEVVKTPLDESVYRNLNTIDSPVLGGLGRAGNPMGTVLRLEEFIVGSDKFEHVFGFGYGFYRLHYEYGLSLETILLINAWFERWVFGSLPTAIDSYADLAVNFRGIELINAFVGEEVDILNAEAPEPYLLCRKGRWQLNPERPFDWRDWIDASWDEGYNCSAFKTQRAADSVVAAIESLEIRTGERHQCPLDMGLFEEAASRYGPYRDAVMNPEHRAIHE